MSNFSLTVLIEVNGEMTKAGSITGTDYKDAVFAYDDSYTANKIKRPGVIHHENRNKQTFFT